MSGYNRVSIAWHMHRGAPTTVILTFLVLASHGVGSFFLLYQTLWWFDMVLHTLGGAWLASVFIVLLPARWAKFPAGLPRPVQSRPAEGAAATAPGQSALNGARLRYVLRIVFLVLIAGAAWELYEYEFAAWATMRFGDLGFYQPALDTLSDLLFDAAGAAAAALFLFRKPGSETLTNRGREDA